jgi:hypothetical protein
LLNYGHVFKPFINAFNKTWETSWYKGAGNRARAVQRLQNFNPTLLIDGDLQLVAILELAYDSGDG